MVLIGPAERQAMLSPEADLFRRLTRAVFRAHGAVFRHGDIVNEPSGQTGARWRVLDLISEGDGSVASIARTTGFSRQSVQRLADALVAERLATYEPHPTDRRKQVISLTDRGRDVLETMETSFDEWSKSLMDQIGTEAALDAIERLTAISRVLDLDIERIKADRSTNKD